MDLRGFSNGFDAREETHFSNGFFFMDEKKCFVKSERRSSRRTQPLSPQIKYCIPI